MHNVRYCGCQKQHQKLVKACCQIEDHICDKQHIHTVPGSYDIINTEYCHKKEQIC